jgi:hypothetical protein
MGSVTPSGNAVEDSVTITPVALVLIMFSQKSLRAGITTALTVCELF